MEYFRKSLKMQSFFAKRHRRKNGKCMANFQDMQHGKTEYARQLRACDLEVQRSRGFQRKRKKKAGEKDIRSMKLFS
jgi:hypothetical protein